MPRPLHSLLLAVLTALLLLQPAVLAGASCAQELLTGCCGCTQSDAAADASSCCAGESEASTPSDADSARGAGECACTLAPVPEASAAPAQDGAGLTSAGARAWIDFGAALSDSTRRVGIPAPPLAAGDGSPPGAAACPHDLASRDGAARYLTFLCTSLR